VSGGLPALSPWQERVFQQAAATHSQGRLGHGLLLAGPPMLGKQAVAEALAARLLCSDPRADGHACGDCRSCRLAVAQTVGLVTTQAHADLQRIGLEPNQAGDKLRTEITVDQIRRLGQWFALSAQHGGAKVAVIAPADLLNTAAANALLKTLEEPAPGRVLLLVSSRPGRLPATVRSRCQRLEFRLPPRDEAIAWLRAGGADPRRVDAALDAARGNPGVAADWLREGGLERRAEVLAGLEALRAGRAGPVDTAQAWLADEHAALRLRFAAEAALALASRQLGAGGDAGGLTGTGDFPKLSAWFDGVNRLREQLGAPLRHDLVLAGLLLDWRGLYAAAGPGRASGRRAG
jgi:DNA polymerase-3 subunit delta'